jgi:hypothetical protein
MNESADTPNEKPNEGEEIWLRTLTLHSRGISGSRFARADGTRRTDWRLDTKSSHGDGWIQCIPKEKPRCLPPLDSYTNDARLVKTTAVPLQLIIPAKLPRTFITLTKI